MGVVDFKIVRQARCTILGRIEITAFEKTPRQDAQPPCHLVEPCAVFGGQVEDMLLGRITQEGTPLHPAVPVLRHTGHVAPLGDQPADREAPVGMEMIHHPVVALHSGEWLDDVGQRRGAVLTGARLAQMPHDVTRGDDQRGHHGTHPMPDGLVLAFFRCARCQGLCGVCALPYLPAGLCIAAHDHTVLRKKASGVEGEETPGVRFGLAVWVVAVEPRDTPVGFEVRVIQQAPETRTTHRPGAPLRKGGD